MKFFAPILTAAAAVLLIGCSSNQPKPAAKAVQDVNKQHTKGTTEVLRNYRYGEPPPGSKRSK